jgi:hypothetical protein
MKDFKTEHDAVLNALRFLIGTLNTEGIYYGTDEEFIDIFGETLTEYRGYVTREKWFAYHEGTLCPCQNEIEVLEWICVFATGLAPAISTWTVGKMWRAEVYV